MYIYTFSKYLLQHWITEIGKCDILSFIGGGGFFGQGIATPMVSKGRQPRAHKHQSVRETFPNKYFIKKFKNLWKNFLKNHYNGLIFN